MKGKKVILRNPELSHMKYLKRWWNQPEISYFDSGDSGNIIPEEEIKRIEGDIASGRLKSWFIIENKFGIPVGCIIYKDLDNEDQSAYIAIWLGKENWNRGYGTDATKVLMQWLFEEMNLRTVKLEVLTFNLRACSVYQKCFFEIVDEFVRDGQRWYYMEADREVFLENIWLYE